jgi:uncharacterized protein DUF4136
MKNAITLLSGACVICVLAACETVSVTTDYDHSASFGKYKTYTLAPPSRGQTMSPSSEAALRDALRTGLVARGISEAPGKKADLDVVRHVFVQEKISVQQYTNWGYGFHGGWPYGYGYYSMWPGAPVTYTDVNQYHEGTMILDFVDAHTKKLVFRGVGKAVVGGPESNAGKIRDAVAKIVAAYPGSASH